MNTCSEQKTAMMKRFKIQFLYTTGYCGHVKASLFFSFLGDNSTYFRLMLKRRRIVLPFFPIATLKKIIQSVLWPVSKIIRGGCYSRRLTLDEIGRIKRKRYLHKYLNDMLKECIVLPKLSRPYNTICSHEEITLSSYC